MYTFGHLFKSSRGSFKIQYQRWVWIWEIASLVNPIIDMTFLGGRNKGSSNTDSVALKLNIIVKKQHFSCAHVKKSYRSVPDLIHAKK